MKNSLEVDQRKTFWFFIIFFKVPEQFISSLLVCLSVGDNDFLKVYQKTQSEDSVRPNTSKKTLTESLGL